MLYNEDEDDNISIRDLDDELKNTIQNKLSINFGTTYWQVDVQQNAKDLFKTLNDKRIDFDPRSIRQYLHKELGWNIMVAGRAHIIAKRIRSYDKSGW